MTEQWKKTTFADVINTPFAVTIAGITLFSLFVWAIGFFIGFGVGSTSFPPPVL